MKIRGFLIPEALKYFYIVRILIVRYFLGNEGLVFLIKNMPYDSLRLFFLEKYGASIGSSVRIGRGFYIHCPSGGNKPFKNLIIGNNVGIDKDVFIDLSDKVIIGDKSFLSCGAKIYTHLSGHNRGKEYIEYVKAPVILGYDCHCYPNSLVTCGVNFGNNVFVGANSFVKAFTNLQSNSLYAGSPALKIKEYDVY